MNFKKIYKSTPEFKEKSRALFLAAYNAKFPLSHRPSLAFKYFVRGAFSGLALIIVLTASATYADQKNVSVSNILYPLKRTSEIVKVAFTSEVNKPEIHLELAERRLAEIKEVRVSSPENPRIGNLSKELEKEINNSILKIEFPKVSGSRSNSPSRSETASEKNSPEAMSVTPSPAPVAGSLSATPSGKDREGDDNSSEKNERTGKTKSLEDRNNDKNNQTPTNETPSSNTLDKRQMKACAFWKEIIEERDFAVTDLVNKTPAIIEKFQENCEPFFGSVIIKNENGEVEVEVED